MVTLHSKWIQLLIFTLIAVFLSGCLYPESEKAKNQIPHEQQLEMVQNAVEQYKEEKNGLVPIKTKPEDTPIFEKYLIDFNLLKEANVLTETPGNAFENGGFYQYAILYPEDDPQVRLIDLRLTETLRMVNVQLDVYRSEHLYPPFGEKIDENIYTIDYEELGLKEAPTVVSPYSQKKLPIIMNENGELFIDYRIDLYEALQEYDHSYENGDDIRFILAENTPFLPAYSLPYTIEDGEPVFMYES